MYVETMSKIAIDDCHGYSMESRWGSPDYDCSSLVISCVDKAGFPVRAYGATYTGNMYDAFIKAGFSDVTKQVNRQTGDGLIKGDILLNVKHHTEMYMGNGIVTGAHWDYDGKPGDSSGMEICSRMYYNYPWDYVLRYDKVTNEVPSYTYSLQEVQLALQCINGEYGAGEERKQKLKAKGFDYTKIQNLINNIIAFVW